MILLSLLIHTTSFSRYRRFRISSHLSTGCILFERIPLNRPDNFQAASHAQCKDAAHCYRGDGVVVCWT